MPACPGWTMIEYRFARNLRILFVGINPHPGSDARGVPFSNNKTFWYLVNRPTPDVTGLKRGEERPGVERATIIRLFSPAANLKTTPFRWVAVCASSTTSPHLYDIRRV